MNKSLLGSLFGLFAAITLFGQAPAGQTSAELPLHTERFSDRVLFEKSLVLDTGDMSFELYQNNVGAIREKIGGK